MGKMTVNPVVAVISPKRQLEEELVQRPCNLKYEFGADVRNYQLVHGPRCQRAEAPDSAAILDLHGQKQC
jgi:hypothetical protein